MFTLKLKMLAIAAAAFLGATSAQAVPTTALYLAMDGSGSISNADFTTQIGGYVGALNAYFAANPSAYGQVAIVGSIFGATQYQFFAPLEITNATVLASLTSAISGLNPGRGGINTGATDITTALLTASNSLVNYQNTFGVGANLHLVIDVTTDGVWNVNGDPQIIADNLNPIPIDQINCLGIGGGANCSFVTLANAGTNFGTVATFADLQNALTAKIRTEVQVPEPMSLALLGLGIAAVGMVRRRRA